MTPSYFGQLGYYTHYQDAEFGLLQLGVRFYDPEVGRFTQRDPLGYPAGLAPYPYAENGPSVLTDPSGLAPSLWDIIVAIIGAAFPEIKAPSCVACLGALVGHMVPCTAGCMSSGEKMIPCIGKCGLEAYDMVWGSTKGQPWYLRCLRLTIRAACDTCIGSSAEKLGEKLRNLLRGLR